MITSIFVYGLFILFQFYFITVLTTCSIFEGIMTPQTSLFGEISSQNRPEIVLWAVLIYRPYIFTLYFCDWIFAFPKTITLSDCGLLASKSSLRSSNSPPRAIKVTFDALEPSSRPLSWIFHYLSPIKLDFREFQKISGAYDNLRNFKELSGDKLGSKWVNLSSFQEIPEWWSY